LERLRAELEGEREARRQAEQKAAVLEARLGDCRERIQVAEQRAAAAEERAHAVEREHQRLERQIRRNRPRSTVQRGNSMHRKQALNSARGGHGKHPMKRLSSVAS
jgi:chromosome segregation ATPase